MGLLIRVAPALAVLLLLVLQLSPATEGVIQCSDVTKDLVQCTGYLKGSVGAPSTACCNGVSALAAAASTTADRRTACNCLQSMSKKMNPSPAAAKALPGSCGISLPYTISPNIDCSSIN